MKTNPIATVLALAALVSNSLLLAQPGGSLTPPPGLPGPTMKTLDEVEARIPINTLPGDATTNHLIALPGSYYLTDPLIASGSKAAIRVEAENVTIDLNGYHIEGTAGSLAGISINLGGGSVTVRNGSLRFLPQGGIISVGATQCIIENIQIASVGGPGISLQGAGAIRQVQVNGAKNAGISIKGGSVIDCTVQTITAGTSGATVSGITAPNGRVSGCTVKSVAGGGGLCQGIGASVVNDCTVESLTNTGDHHTVGIMALTLDAGGGSQRTGSVTSSRVRAVASNGLGSGIYGFGTTRGCSVFDVTTTAVAAYGIESSSVHECHVSKITTTNNAGANGISAAAVFDSTVTEVQNPAGGECIGIILVDSGAFGEAMIARGCRVSGAKSYGMYVISGSHVSGCAVVMSGYSGTAFFTVGSGNTFEGNNAIALNNGSGKGFSGESGNWYMRNVARGFNSNFHFSANIVTSQNTATNPFSNLSLAN